jgi:hypothetical protein
MILKEIQPEGRKSGIFTLIGNEPNRSFQRPKKGNHFPQEVLQVFGSYQVKNTPEV